MTIKRQLTKNVEIYFDNLSGLMGKVKIEDWITSRGIVYNRIETTADNFSRLSYYYCSMFYILLIHNARG